MPLHDLEAREEIRGAAALAAVEGHCAQHAAGRDAAHRRNAVDGRGPGLGVPGAKPDSAPMFPSKLKGSDKD